MEVTDLQVSLEGEEMPQQLLEDQESLTMVAEIRVCELRGWKINQ